MSGVVSFNAKVSVPPGKRPFLDKVELQGDVGIDGGRFTKSDTQQGVNSLSQGALAVKNHKTENDDTDLRNVLSDLKAHILLRNGSHVLQSFLRRAGSIGADAGDLQLDQREN
jgi:hypothetical protein